MLDIQSKHLYKFDQMKTTFILMLYKYAYIGSQNRSSAGVCTPVASTCKV